MATLLNDTDTRDSYVATASQTSFPYTFWIKQESDLRVFVNGTEQTLTTDYTVSAVQETTGANVVFNSGLSSGDNVVITYSPAIKRQTQFQTSGDFKAIDLNLELTYILSVMQSLKTNEARTVILAPTDTTSFDPVLPEVSANKMLLINSAGDGFALSQSDFANIETNLNTVAGSIANVDTTATNISSVNTVATNISNVGTVAGSITNVNNVNGSITTVNTVATNITSVNTVATNITDVSTAASNITAIQNAPGAATDAANARDKAQEWADNNEDVPVETSPDLFSAKHWAAKAAASASGSAADVSYSNTNSVLTSTNVKAALDEVSDVTVNSIGSIGGGTQDINLNNGRTITATVDTSSTTFTFSNPYATGNADAFDLYLTNGGSQTITWPTSVDWVGGSAPDLTAAGLDHLVFFTNDGGTTWYGYVAGLELS